jgi:hypothetical protein
VSQLERAEASGGALAVHVEDDLVMVAGDETALEAWKQQLVRKQIDFVSPVDRQLVAAAAAALSSAAGITGTHGQYFKFSPDSMRKLDTMGAIRAENGFFHMFVKDRGQFSGNLQWQPVHLAGEQALALQTMGTTAALMVAIRDVQQAVERVEDKVTEVLVMAEAQHVGDVIGRYRFLKERADAVGTTGRLSRTDWDAVAPVGADVAATVERLRAFLRLNLETLPLEGPVNDRAEKLERLVTRGKFVEGLGLLLVAEQSLFFWHRLRLRRLQQEEPDHLEDAVIEARKILAEAQRQDGVLVSRLFELLSSYGTVAPLEIHRVLSRRKLGAHVTLLREALERYAAARNAQVSSWPEVEEPTFRDAIDAINSSARTVATGARQLGEGAAVGVGKAWGSARDRVQGAIPRKKGLSDAPEEPPH